MIRSANTLTGFCIVLALGLLPGKAAADHDLDMEYAQHQPLATESMLLDITRIGGTMVAVGERGIIITSTEGDTWKQAEVVPTRSTLTTVFSDGHRLWAGGHDATILTSGDQGRNWTRQFFDAERQQAVMDIYFSDENNGVAIGSYGLYLTTNNGGHTWEDATVDPDIDYHLNSLLVLDEDRWLIAGEAGYSYRSYDAGQTWETLELPYQGSMWGALKTTDDCVLFFGLRGHVMQSCDFGSSWVEVETGSEASISGGVQNDGFILLAANSGTLLIKDDGGPMRVHHHSSGVDFAAALPVGETDFLLVGEGGVHRFPETAEEGQNND